MVQFSSVKHSLCKRSILELEAFARVRFSHVGDRGWIGGGNTVKLELELINDRGLGPPAPHRRGRGYKRGYACSEILDVYDSCRAIAYIDAGLAY
jgi:hypothetical protein